MARISTYSSDTSITGVEKLLGTDAGTTKLFSLSDLQTYFTQTVTLSSTLGSDLLPSSDGTFDLGSSSAEWQDLFICLQSVKSRSERVQKILSRSKRKKDMIFPTIPISDLIDIL